MNYSINAKKLQSQYNQSKPSGLILASYISLQRLNRSRYQLEQIAESHPESGIRKQATVFMRQNKKLSSIANDLITRLKRTSISGNPAESPDQPKESLIQLKMEVDMLDDMHFEMAKSYASFIYKHYEATVIPLKTLQQ